MPKKILPEFPKNYSPVPNQFLTVAVRLISRSPHTPYGEPKTRLQQCSEKHLLNESSAPSEVKPKMGQRMILLEPPIFCLGTFVGMARESVALGLQPRPLPFQAQFFEVIVNKCVFIDIWRKKILAYDLLIFISQKKGK